MEIGEGENGPLYTALQNSSLHSFHQVRIIYICGGPARARRPPPPLGVLVLEIFDIIHFPSSSFCRFSRYIGHAIFINGGSHEITHVFHLNTVKPLISNTSEFIKCRLFFNEFYTILGKFHYLRK